ncbi:hypothetical protein PTKIN_Ptkin15bG0038400 [Pterospermum kingtungense]
MIEGGKSKSNFRLVIVKGKAYVEKYSKPYQTRDVFTIWGILQLLRLYPGMVPDLDLLFYSGDSTVIMKRDYRGPNATSPPPVFHYCGQEESLDIVFPDWTFWGWAEVNIKPWEETLKAIKEGRKKINWENRAPSAYWKGNPYVSVDREDLLKCNLSDKYDWNVRLYSQDWGKEIKEGFKHSKLEDQCTHRYKIYIEGRTWSVSEKYILACNSMALMIEPRYFDFFSRSMVPLLHYWPIRTKTKCRDLKFSVEWGNNHTKKARAIGEAGSKLIEEFLTMRNVYDYMFHLLNEYSKLLKFKPTIPLKAKRVCSEMTACSEKGLWKEFMVQSMVKHPEGVLFTDEITTFHGRQRRRTTVIVDTMREWEQQQHHQQSQQAAPNQVDMNINVGQYNEGAHGEQLRREDVVQGQPQPLATLYPPKLLGEWQRYIRWNLKT